jgi:diguanylate cyclase (GGDEF)-like protein
VTGSDSSWSTQQLTELLALVSALPADADVAQRAVEHAAEALEAEVGALVATDEVVACVGYPRDAVPTADLLAARTGTHLEVPGVGACAVMVADCDALPGGHLLIARSGSAPITSEDRGLVRGLARVLSLALQARRVVADERRRRTDSENEVRRHELLLAQLSERQTLLERLAKVQRSISTRRPLDEVLETIVDGASELIGDEVVGLRLIDPDDPQQMTLAACTGLTAAELSKTRYSRIDEGMGGRAVTERRLVCTEDYGHDDYALSFFVESGTKAAMAAPVYRGSEVIGSLVVSTAREGRRYSESEKDVLLAFAEHASLAVNDARTVEALRTAVDKATHEAKHDGLTGLPNRSRFLELVQQSLTRGDTVGVLFIDLDDFKLINDTLGHPVGDGLLRAVANRLRRGIRGDDVVARLGGDEFAVLLSCTSHDDTVTTAERVRSGLARPFHLPGHQVSVGASTGVVVWPPGSTASAEDLLRDADVAMYKAKSYGKGQAVLFEPSMRQDLQARSRMEYDLRKALDRGQLRAHYQPVVDVTLGRVVGAEALIRWEHPERGFVPPSDFVPVAEETGMVLELGRVVLNQACHQAAAWQADPRTAGMSVSVNVSARQLAEAGFLEDVQAALQLSQLDPRLLSLELTESVLVRDLDSAALTLQSLADLGVRIAIDDFGTAYSSLSYLASLPITVLKIDRSFVRGPGLRIAAGIESLAEGLGLTTVVEGVETEAELASLTALGCRAFQGYLWSPAVPEDQVAEVAERVRAGLRPVVPAPRGASSGVRPLHATPTSRTG